MKHLTAKLVVLAALGLTLGGVGCSGSQAKCKAASSSIITNTAVAQSSAITKYARWLPSDSLGVIVIDVRPVMEAYFHSFEVGSADKAAAKARRSQVEMELSQLSVKRLGMDITKAEQIIVGVGLAWQSVIVTGISSKVKVTNAKMIQGFETFKLASSSPKDEPIFRDMPVHGFKLKGDNAVVMVTKPAAVEGVITTKSLSLANEPAALKRLVGLMPNRPARVSVAVTLDNPIVQRGINPDKVPFALPNAVSMEMGDTLTVQFHGNKADLKKMHDEVMVQYNKWSEQIEKSYKERDTKNIAVAAINITAYHNTKKYGDVLKPTFTDKTMTYEYVLPDNPVALALGSVVGVAAAALPAFILFNEKSMTAPSAIEPAPKVVQPAPTTQP